MHRNLEVEKNPSDSQFIHRVGRPQRYLGGDPLVVLSRSPTNLFIIAFQRNLPSFGEGGRLPWNTMMNYKNKIRSQCFSPRKNRLLNLLNFSKLKLFLWWVYKFRFLQCDFPTFLTLIFMSVISDTNIICLKTIQQVQIFMINKLVEIVEKTKCIVLEKRTFRSLKKFYFWPSPPEKIIPFWRTKSTA